MVTQQVFTQSSKKNKSKKLQWTKSKQTQGNFKREKDKRFLVLGIRFNHLKGWISPQPAGFLFHHQSPNEKLFFYR